MKTAVVAAVVAAVRALRTRPEHPRSPEDELFNMGRKRWGHLVRKPMLDYLACKRKLSRLYTHHNES
ncbi:MAG: hypothetical protein M3Q29_24185 [Chloroflexota bacterium]|nr:hypothetical protein [Chloroflexota bacterium]